jgi:ketosteroid isomerase-like protein
MKKRFLLAVIIVLLALINVVDGQTNDARLKSLVRQMIDAQVGYDAATLDKIYAADFVEISPVGEYDSREKAIGFYKPEATPNRDKIKRVVEAGEITIRDYGKFAVVIARVTASRTVEGQQPRSPVSFRTTFVCRKQKGDWKIASVQYTGMRPPITQPAK